MRISPDKDRAQGADTKAQVGTGIMLPQHNVAALQAEPNKGEHHLCEKHRGQT